MAALSSRGTVNGKSWCGWDLEQIKHFKHWRGWPGPARSRSGGLWRTGHGGLHSTPGPLAKQMSARRESPCESLAPIASTAKPRGVPLEGTSRKLVKCVVNKSFFMEKKTGRRRLSSMPMSDEQIKEQISYLETRIERQRAVIDEKTVAHVRVRALASARLYRTARLSVWRSDANCSD
jgi:hypothetical protein